jgi:hypothetical protein
MSVPDITGGDDAGGGDTGGGAAGDVPQDCDGAIAYVEDLMDQHDTMMDMNISEMTNFGAVSSVITTDCSLQEMQDFFDRQDVKDWMGSSG